MPQERKPLVFSSKSAVALLLTFTAGSVDVIGFLTLHHVFTAHVSGTTAHLGIDVAGHQWSEAAIAASVIGAFLFGSVLGRGIIEVGAQVRFRRIASVTLTIEALLIVLFAIEIPKGTYRNGTVQVQSICWLLGLLGCAMGIQTATLTRVGSLTIHTTFVTGMLNKLAQLLSHVLFQSYGVWQAAGPDRKAHYRRVRRDSVSQAILIGGIWFLYLAGAVQGAYLYRHFGPPALYLGVSMLACAVAVDWIRPLSIEEERDQSER